MDELFKVIDAFDMIFCANCKEYKGIEFDEETDTYYCIFCQ